jgi:hypothetical protein
MPYAPFKIPALPMPAIALPMINMFDDTAAPQTAEPISKTPKNMINVHCWADKSL